MKQIGEERTMTVKNVADVLGYEKDYLRKKVKEMFPDSVTNGKETRLTESQVTMLKKELTPRTLDLKIQGQSAVTEIEKDETILKAMQYMKERYENALKRALEAGNNLCCLYLNRLCMS